MNIWQWLLCRIGWHGIIIRDGWARCAHWRCTWAEALPGTTHCYCPVCAHDLCYGGELLADTDLVRYRCNACGHLSGWDLDAPAPLLREGSVNAH